MGTTRARSLDTPIEHGVSHAIRRLRQEVHDREGVHEARHHTTVARASMNDFTEKVSKASVALGVAGAVLAQSAGAVTYDELQGLTYLQVKGTGLADTCPVVEGGVSGKEIKAGDYALERFCMEPTSFTVKEESQFKQGESEFSKTRLMTRLTYTLRHDWLLQGWLRWLRQRPRERWPRLRPGHRAIAGWRARAVLVHAQGVHWQG